MTDDPFKEASKYNTAVRREKRRHGWAIQREAENHQRRLHALRAALSPAAARIVVAAEQQPVPSTELPSRQAEIAAKRQELIDAGLMVDNNPAPAWLNQEPAPLPAGALLEVPERPARRRA